MQCYNDKRKRLLRSGYGTYEENKPYEAAKLYDNDKTHDNQEQDTDGHHGCPDALQRPDNLGLVHCQQQDG